MRIQYWQNYKKNIYATGFKLHFKLLRLNYISQKGNYIPLDM